MTFPEINILLRRIKTYDVKQGLNIAPPIVLRKDTDNCIKMPGANRFVFVNAYDILEFAKFSFIDIPLINCLLTIRLDISPLSAHKVLRPTHL